MKFYIVALGIVIGNFFLREIYNLITIIYLQDLIRSSNRFFYEEIVIVFGIFIAYVISRKEKINGRLNLIPIEKWLLISVVCVFLIVWWEYIRSRVLFFFPDELRILFAYVPRLPIAILSNSPTILSVTGFILALQVYWIALRANRLPKIQAE